MIGLGLSPTATERLRSAGVDLRVLSALFEAKALRRLNEHAVVIQCDRPNGSAEDWHVAIDDGPEPWLGDGEAAAWWPVGKDGTTAIIVVGLESALALLSILYGVGEDGTLHRRPRLPGPLADAVPVVLPESAQEVPVEWLRDEAPRELVDQLSGFELAFLALPIEPKVLPAAEIAIRDLTDGCAFLAPDGLIVAPVFLPGGVRLTDPALPFDGYGRAYALAGSLEFWRWVALNPPATEEEL